MTARWPTEGRDVATHTDCTTAARGRRYILMTTPCGLYLIITPLTRHWKMRAHAAKFAGRIMPTLRQNCTSARVEARRECKKVTRRLCRISRGQLDACRAIFTILLFPMYATHTNLKDRVVHAVQKGLSVTFMIYSPA